MNWLHIIQLLSNTLCVGFTLKMQMLQMDVHIIITKNNVNIMNVLPYMYVYNYYVTVSAKTRHVHTQTEIHFIAPAYSYTK